MVSGITLSARECNWIVYFGETPYQDFAVKASCRRSWKDASQ